jgi:hypothetical protein
LRVERNTGSNERLAVAVENTTTMTESQKALLGFLIVICGFVAFFAWAADFVYPPLTWAGRTVAPVVAVGAGAVLIMARHKRDEVPDFIRQQGIQPFERDGLCFAILPGVADERLNIRVLFQNSYERRCSAQIVCKPALGFWLQKVPISGFTIDVVCPPAGYGTADLFVAVPEEYQGKQIEYEIGSDIAYPDGRGRRLRHKTGIHVGKPIFTNRFRAFLSVVGSFGGFHTLQPASFTLTLPQGAATKLKESPGPQINYVWKLGDEIPRKIDFDQVMC